MKRILAGLALVLLLAGALLWWKAQSPSAETPSPTPEAAERPPAAAKAPPSSTAKDNPPEPVPSRAEPATSRLQTPADHRDSETADTTGPDPENVASLKRGREEGEPRTPPLAEDRPGREMPSAEELADTDLYLEYEARQKADVLSSFIQASRKKSQELNKAIERAEAEGLPEEQLEEGREKLRQLEATRKELEEQYPELVEGEAGGEKLE